MKYTLKELIDTPALQALTDELYAVASIPSAIITMDGEILTGSGWQKICTDFHRKHPQIEKECIESDTTIRRGLDGGEPFVIYKCPRGLVDASSPIIIAGEHIANVFSGQVFLESRDETTERFFREQARKFGFDEAEYIKAFKEVPIFKEKKFRAGISFLTKLAQTIAENGLTRLRELEAMESVRESEDRFRAAFDSAQDCVLIWDKEYNYLYANQAAIDHVDTTPDQVIGKNMRDGLGHVPEFMRLWMSRVDKVFETGEKLRVQDEQEMLGRQYHTDSILTPIRDTMGKVISVCVVYRDVTEIKLAEEALRESEDKFRNFAEQSLVGIYLISDGLFKYVNPKFAEMFGYSVDECLNNMHFQQLVHPDDLATVTKQVGKRLSGETKVVRYSFRGIKKSGETIHVEIFGSSMVLKGKTVATGAMLDITESKRAQEALLNKSYFLQKAQEIGKIGTWELDIKKNELLWTNENYRIFGLPIGTKLTYEIFLNCVHPDDREYVDTEWKAAFDKKPYDIEHRLLVDGDVKWVREKAELEFNEKDECIRGTGFTQDITERKQAAEELREREEKYRSLVESTDDSIYLLDKNSIYLFMNEKHLSRLGLQPDETLGRTYGEFHSENDTQELGSIVEEVFEIGRPIQQDHRSLKDNRHFLRTFSPVKESDGKTQAITVVSKDITERIKAENALKKSEERYRSLVENQTDLISRFTPDGTFVFVNDAYCHFFEKPKDELIGKKWQPLPVDDDIPLIQEKLQTLSPSNPTVFIDNRILSGKGNIHWVQFVNSGLFDADGNLLEIQSVGRDITERMQKEEERKQLQDKLQRAQKMESLGLMAGGIAHDLNNILSGIVSYPELLLMDLAEDSPLRKPIKTIQESGMRAADVVEDLLTVARGVATGKDILNLNTLITEYLGSAEYEKLEKTRAFVNFKTELDPNLLNMSGSATHIKKTLMNLAVNASEAIEGDGTITISTMNRYMDEPLKGYEDVRMGEYVVLNVSDDGSGISPQDLERIFEPFYTKKQMGRSGTGLGLAVVWNTVQDHNGYINVNTSQKGTAFELYFPVSREKVAAEREEIPLEDYLGHGEKILVVDDEQRQREIASGILTRLGYTAEAVSSGEDAIEYVKTNSVDLILLDMVMPKGINGRKTYEEIIKIRPGQKAIIASGYAKTKEVDLAQELGAGKYIKKPYTLAKVGVAVKEELGK